MKYILSIITGICLLFSCKGKTSKTDLNDAQSLLWRVSKDGVKTSYLFGTMHLICNEDYIWTEAMKKSLSASDEVCFEMDMDDPAVLTATAEGLMDTDNANSRKLRDYFTEEEYARLDAFMKDTMGMPLGMFQDMKPAMLQTLFITKAVDCPIPVSYEANIMDAAKKERKEIRGLEAPEEQIALLNNIPDDSAARSLIQSIDSFADSKKEYQQMVASYKNQDLAALSEQINEASDKDLMGGNTADFLDNRNRKWIDRMAKMMKSKSVFFAVGAGHLWGKEGVIQLLRKQGYTVEPVR